MLSIISLLRPCSAMETKTDQSPGSTSENGTPARASLRRCSEPRPTYLLPNLNEEISLYARRAFTSMLVASVPIGTGTGFMTDRSVRSRIRMPPIPSEARKPGSRGPQVSPEHQSSAIHFNYLEARRGGQSQQRKERGINSFSAIPQT